MGCKVTHASLSGSSIGLRPPVTHAATAAENLPMNVQIKQAPILTIPEWIYFFFF